MTAYRTALAAGRRAASEGGLNIETTDTSTLARHIAEYVPADVVAVYVPVASIFATNTAITSGTRGAIALASALLAAVYVLSLAWWQARIVASRTGPGRPLNRAAVLKETAFPAVAAAIALFAWATATPGSWFDWTALQGFQVVLVAVTALVLGTAGRFLAPLPRD